MSNYAQGRQLTHQPTQLGHLRSTSTTTDIHMHILCTPCTMCTRRTFCLWCSPCPPTPFKTALRRRIDGQRTLCTTVHHCSPLQAPLRRQARQTRPRTLRCAGLTAVRARARDMRMGGSNVSAEQAPPRRCRGGSVLCTRRRLGRVGSAATLRSTTAQCPLSLSLSPLPWMSDASFTRTTRTYEERPGLGLLATGVRAWGLSVGRKRFR